MKNKNVSTPSEDHPEEPRSNASTYYTKYTTNNNYKEATEPQPQGALSSNPS
jgi:hypothetical protein